MHQRTQLGKEGEDRVARYLKDKGFYILEQNYRKPYGEVDIIACKGNLILFVEVKTRQKEYGDIAEIILPSKQKKIITVAKTYIARHNHDTKTCRFDVAFVEGIAERTRINYIENAFQEPDGYY